MFIKIIFYWIWGRDIWGRYLGRIILGTFSADFGGDFFGNGFERGLTQMGGWNGRGIVGLSFQ
jgi:hypothetical protein